jgi:hypothetical protein
MCPWNQNIPQPTDQISDSQNDLLNNFQSINTLINVNHVTFDDPNQGKHFFVEMPQQAAASVTAAGEVGLQCLASAYGAGAPTLVYLPQSAGTPIEMTSANIATQGWSFLPSGVLVKWGNFNAAGPGAGAINLNGAGQPHYGSSILFATFQPVGTTAHPDPNLSVYINTTTTTVSSLAYTVVARDSALATFPAVIYYYTIGT